MKFGKRIAALACAGVLCLSLTACDEMNGQDQEIHNTYEAGNTLMKNQPTPTDLEYSLERYNLIRRAYWVNGQREKAVLPVKEKEIDNTGKQHAEGKDYHAVCGTADASVI